jgi:hypothetical protein
MATVKESLTVRRDGTSSARNLISILFDKGRSTITEHLKNVFETGR